MTSSMICLQLQTELASGNNEKVAELTALPTKPTYQQALHKVSDTLIAKKLICTFNHLVASNMVKLCGNTELARFQNSQILLAFTDFVH